MTGAKQPFSEHAETTRLTRTVTQLYNDGVNWKLTNKRGPCGLPQKKVMKRSLNSSLSWGALSFEIHEGQFTIFEEKRVHLRGTKNDLMTYFIKCCLKRALSREKNMSTGVFTHKELSGNELSFSQSMHNRNNNKGIQMWKGTITRPRFRKTPTPQKIMEAKIAEPDLYTSAGPRFSEGSFFLHKTVEL